MNPEPSPSPHFAPVRRKDKAVEDSEWIQEILRKGAYGILATSIDQQPYARPSLYYYDESNRCIYLHGARQGRTPDSLEGSPSVCFCVSEMGRLLPAGTALEFGVEYASVIVFGKALLIQDDEEAKRAMQLLLDKYFPHLHPGEHYRPITPEEMHRTAVYRIEIETWSGKNAQAPEGFPGAFFYNSAVSHDHS
jgi:uncharacterized protein